MASSKEYLDFVLGQLSGLEDITCRSMMSEYIIYYQGKIIGGIYDDRLLVKDVPSAVTYLSKVTYETPYDGAKDMILVDNVDNKDYLQGLFQAMVGECSAPKQKKKK